MSFHVCTSNLHTCFNLFAQIEIILIHYQKNNGKWNFI